MVTSAPISCGRGQGQVGTGSSPGTHVVREGKEEEEGAGQAEWGSSWQHHSQIPMQSSPPSFPSMEPPSEPLALPPPLLLSAKVAGKSVSSICWEGCSLPPLPTPFRAHLWFGPGTCHGSELSTPHPTLSLKLRGPPGFIKAAMAHSGQRSGSSSAFLQKGLQHSSYFLRATETWGLQCLALGLSCGGQA